MKTIIDPLVKAFSLLEPNQDRNDVRDAMTHIDEALRILESKRNEKINDRLEMLMVITRNELDWLVGGNATHDEMNNSVRFFAEGGFSKWSDDQIKKAFDNLIS